MNQYQKNLIAAMTSNIDKRANKISALEMFREAYHTLGRGKAKREIEEELDTLRLQQVISKRAIGMIVTQQRYINYLEDVACGEYPEAE